MRPSNIRFPKPIISRPSSGSSYRPLLPSSKRDNNVHRRAHYQGPRRQYQQHPASFIRNNQQQQQPHRRQPVGTVKRRFFGDNLNDFLMILRIPSQDVEGSSSSILFSNNSTIQGCNSVFILFHEQYNKIGVDFIFKSFSGVPLHFMVLGETRSHFESHHVKLVYKILYHNILYIHSRSKKHEKEIRIQIESWL